LLVLQHVKEAARSTSVAREKAVVERLRKEQEETARNSEAAL
jgi:hypothetical protein